MAMGKRNLKTLPADAPTVLSAFTGLGGLDLGLEAAGFRSVGCIEWDELARESLEKNRAQSWPLLATGIAEAARTITPADIRLEVGELTLLAGAPPCQPFSKAGQWAQNGRAGLTDPRSTFLGDFFHLVERFLPEAVIIENVTGFVRGSTSALSYLQRQLAGINDRRRVQYRLAWQVCDAAHYGVPQRRRRAIVVLLRDRSQFHWPAKRYVQRPVTAWDAIGCDPPPGAPLPKAVGKWADLLPSIPEGRNYLWHTPRGDGEPLFSYRSRYWSFLLKLSRNDPSWTLAASPGPSTGPFHWDNRPLATWELLRLQTLPESWQVSGTYRDQVRQIGNATPVLLAEVLGRSMLRTLGRPIPPSVTYRIRRRQPPPPAAAPGPVPKRYLSLRGPHPDHAGTGRGPRPRTDQVTLYAELTK